MEQGSVIAWLQNFWQESIEIFLAGGWLMVPLALIALIIYWTAFEMYFYFSVHRFYRRNKDTITSWIRNPEQAEGEIKGIVDYTQLDIRSLDDVRNRFTEVRNAYLSRVDGRRPYLFTLVSTAPLLGLLGTVTGMLATFAALAISSGGQTVDMVAGGISEALITTQTGLIIAIPGYVLNYMVQKRRDEMDACLVGMETVTVQLFEKKLKETAA